MSTQLLLVALIIVVVALLLWLWFRSYTLKRASNMVQQVFPVWAAQGPFQSGEQSAVAMRYAYMTVLGPEETERMAEAIRKHAISYDGDSSKWEQTRLEAARSAGPETEEFVTIAKGLAAMDSLNKDFLEEGGHKLELARQRDGTLGIAHKKIWSDGAIEEKKKRDSEAIVSGIGKGLLNDSSKEARELVQFLSELYKANTGEELDSESAIGRAWLAYIEIRNDEPESELAKEFERLSRAHQEILPGPDE